MKQTDIIVPYEQKNEPDVRAAISGLPSYTAVRAQVVVVNAHYAGPPSHIIDFFMPEGGQFCLLKITIFNYQKQEFQFF